MFEQDDDFVFLQTASVIRTDGIVDLDAASGDELADFGPRRTAETGTEHLGERVPGFGGQHGKRR
jgi:hypothetical protein